MQDITISGIHIHSDYEYQYILYIKLLVSINNILNINDNVPMQYKIIASIDVHSEGVQALLTSQL